MKKTKAVLLILTCLFSQAYATTKILFLGPENIIINTIGSLFRDGATCQIPYQNAQIQEQAACDDSIKLLDTSKLADMASGQHNSKNANLSIIQAIEKHLQECPNQLTSIVLILPAYLIHEKAVSEQVFNKIQTLFSAQVLARVYIFINHAPTRYLGNHDKKEQPMYIARFNDYLDQTDLNTIGRTIQEFFDEVKHFEQPLRILENTNLTTQINQLIDYLNATVKVYSIANEIAHAAQRTFLRKKPEELNAILRQLVALKKCLSDNQETPINLIDKRNYSFISDGIDSNLQEIINYFERKICPSWINKSEEERSRLRIECLCQLFDYFADAVEQYLRAQR